MTSGPIQLDPDDEGAVKAIYDLHAAPLLSWARRRFPDPREAEEVVQDTIVLAWRKGHLYDPARGSERSWLFGILRNVANSRHRKNERGLQIVRPIRSDDQIGSRTAEEDYELERAQIVEAINSLNEDHRRVIIEAYYRGSLMRAIADELDIPEGTVKSRLYYGLRSLRTELEERGVLQ